METSHYMEITQSVIAERQTMKETQVYRTSHPSLDNQKIETSQNMEANQALKTSHRGK